MCTVASKDNRVWRDYKCRKKLAHFVCEKIVSNISFAPISFQDKKKLYLGLNSKQSASDVIIQAMINILVPWLDITETVVVVLLHFSITVNHRFQVLPKFGRMWLSIYLSGYRCPLDCSHTIQPTSLKLWHNIPHVYNSKRFFVQIFEKLFFFRVIALFLYFFKISL